MAFVLHNSVVSGCHLFELAMRFNLSSYDAAYLELAMRHGLPLATQDEHLKLAATAAKVGVL